VSTRPEQSWSLWCDWPTCGHQFEYGDYSIFGDGFEPDEIVRESDGWVGADGKHYCYEHLTVWPSDHEDGSPYPAPPFLLIGDGDPLVDSDGTVRLVTHLHAGEPCVKPEACPHGADAREAEHYDALITAEGVR
jgi:hypothetical protein